MLNKNLDPKLLIYLPFECTIFSMLQQYITPISE